MDNVQFDELPGREALHRQVDCGLWTVDHRLNPSPPRRLIINADDFGRSSSINAAVIRSHREGILTTASLMVNEAASSEAVVLAKAHPRLGVGLHLTLLCGHSSLPRETIPGLVNEAGAFR